MARHQARRAPDPEPRTPLELAQRMAAGYSPPESAVRGWRETHPQLWAVAVDEGDRAHWLRQAGIAPAALAPVARRRGNAPQARGEAPFDLHKVLGRARQFETPTIALAIVSLEAKKQLLLLDSEYARALGPEVVSAALQQIELDLERAREAFANPDPEPAPESEATPESRPAAKAKTGHKDDPRTSKKPATVKMLFAMLDGLKESEQQIVDAINLLHDRLEKIEAAGGAKPTMQMREGRMLYCGSWRNDENYDQGEYVSHDGAMWLALTRSTGARPGGKSTSTYWRLTVKRGEME
ncbi:MAG: hypothetical protein GEV05_27400 [Betaproteobacteria bacterium]|nr:hypothetical protein [Betaproteobacteria bacterium]